jgi:hypothetical protein
MLILDGTVGEGGSIVVEPGASDGEGLVVGALEG